MLKKVNEGVEYFESIYDKLQASSNQAQKEKLELDLKTQIKKLQRMRDLIRTWITNNNIRDKSALVYNRKLIETLQNQSVETLSTSFTQTSHPQQMEKFKACEKEMKTKTFSKEGLWQATKLNPKEQEKEEIMSWLQQKVEELQLQIEQAEAEIESILAGKNQGKSATASARPKELETMNKRRKWHINRLEIVLRLLSNGFLDINKAVMLKDYVAYFVESNTEPDFDEYEGVYDDLDLDTEEQRFRSLAYDDDDSDESDDEDYGSTAIVWKNNSPILKKATTSLGDGAIDGSVLPAPSVPVIQQRHRAFSFSDFGLFLKKPTFSIEETDHPDSENMGYFTSSNQMGNSVQISNLESDNNLNLQVDRSDSLEALTSKSVLVESVLNLSDPELSNAELDPNTSTDNNLPQSTATEQLSAGDHLPESAKRNDTSSRLSHQQKIYGGTFNTAERDVHTTTNNTNSTIVTYNNCGIQDWLIIGVIVTGGGIDGLSLDSYT
ncbi:hypothetical protein GYMLUDRAFT_242467 [Collybiopsis luxurians FD-317 M1]|uniref:CCR4-Not complex component Not N-terminal domain-containing protein n=1 Tax=Collybiopsis luxurians FD-317 M1 TaxID=944289 RepID=A0A0D0C3U4_9AGAR|nr:hypothetical protein GYMLUDRAFT_242467 [Collybiopsis luxurians FD-317 M1]